MGDAALRGVHEALLLRVAGSLPELPDGEARRARVRRVARGCLPSGRVWAAMFRGVAEGSDEEVVREVYEGWRGVSLEADGGWARWLLSRGRGAEAAAAMGVGGRLSEPGK
ncbi:hypothetical protein BC834DRAFT_872194 [Gloeopeniophorella convolvens]|nr:hypothetical protein BC834DRAFT_872194 [Gloeopeniophorella convolvens]